MADRLTPAAWPVHTDDPEGVTLGSPSGEVYVLAAPRCYGEPCVRVEVATGWEREPADLTADECRNLAARLTSAANLLDQITDGTFEVPPSTYQPRELTPLERRLAGVYTANLQNLTRQGFLADTVIGRALDDAAAGDTIRVALDDAPSYDEAPS